LRFSCLLDAATHHDQSAILQSTGKVGKEKPVEFVGFDNVVEFNKIDRMMMTY
jgi:hypothetical protein